MIHTFNIVQTVSFLAAFTALASRLFVASRPFWSRLPAWAQTLLPVLVPTLTAFTQGLLGVHTWSDLSVQFLVCAGMLLPGLPSNRSSAPLQAGKPPTLTPSAGDQAVAQEIANPSPPKSQKPPKPPEPPYIPTNTMTLLLCLGLILDTTQCAIFGSHGSFWPEVTQCAPSKQELVLEVESVLLAGGDYEASLVALAKSEGAALVECAIKTAVDVLASKVGASPAEGVAVARGKAFLAEHPVAP
jgi:hypothetical protein